MKYFIEIIAPKKVYYYKLSEKKFRNLLDKENFIELNNHKYKILENSFFIREKGVFKKQYLMLIYREGQPEPIIYESKNDNWIIEKIIQNHVISEFLQGTKGWDTLMVIIMLIMGIVIGMLMGIVSYPHIFASSSPPPLK